MQQPNVQGLNVSHMAGFHFNVVLVTEVDLAALALCLFLPHSQCPALAAAQAAG